MNLRLDIPAGWALTYNQFKDVDPIIEENTIINWDAFKESLLQLVQMNMQKGLYTIQYPYLMIDMGFYPEADPDGSFIAQLVTVTENEGWVEHDEFKSKDRYEIRKTIESWMQKHA